MAGETFTVPGRGRRLDVHFGLGQELFVCGLDSGDHAVCSSLIWSAPGPAARQAAFDALPHVQRLSSNDISGQAGSGSVQKTAASISASLHSACSLEDDMAAQGADTLLSTESAVWDLIVLLFVDQGKDGYIAESLSKWTKQHAAILGAGLEADCTQFYQAIIQELRGSAGRWSAEMEQLYWKLLQQVLAQGWREVAQDLIAEHWVQGAAQRESADSELTAADHRTHSLLHVLSVVLAKAPSYLDARPGPWTSFQEFLDYRATWVQTVVDLLDGDDFEGEGRGEASMAQRIGAVSEVETAFRILSAGREGVEGSAVAAVSVSWLHLLVALLSHVFPNTRVSPELAVLADYCLERRDAQLPVHALAGDILRAAVARDAPAALRACSRSGLCSEWLLAHAAALLAAHGAEYRDQLSGQSARNARDVAAAPRPPTVARLLQHCEFDVPEFFMLRYVSTLLAHAGTWRLALSYLSMCAKGGQAAAAVVVSRWPTCAPGYAARPGQLAEYAARLDLQSSSCQVGRCEAMASWQAGHLAVAVQAIMHTPFSPAWLTLFLLPLSHRLLDHLASDAPLSAPPPEFDCLSGLLSGGLADGPAHARQRGSFYAAPAASFGPPADSAELSACVAVYGALCRACKALADVSPLAQGLIAKHGAVRGPQLSALQGDVRKHAQDLLNSLLPAKLRPRLLMKLVPYLEGSSRLFSHAQLLQMLVCVEDARGSAEVVVGSRIVSHDCLLSETESKALGAALIQCVAVSAAGGL